MEYAIRFANAGTWSGASGFNTLTSSLSIATSAPSNSAPPDATFVLK
jgi:hypothetical protein